MGGHSPEAELLAAQAGAPIVEEGCANAQAVALMVEGERAYKLNMLPGIVEQVENATGVNLLSLLLGAGTAPPVPTGPAPTSSRASRTPDSGGYESCGGFP